MADYFTEIVRKLASFGIENPRLEARILTAHVLKLRSDEVFAGISVSDEDKAKIEALLEERLKHKPLDKIIGYRAFYKANFIVDKNVLSPRPDTEILVEEALAYLQNICHPKILDLGTGSGCIIETLLSEMPTASGVAADISVEALKIAQQNAQNLRVTERLKFVQADWFNADFTSRINDVFDVIVSNPPYIPTSDIAGLDIEVREYDPLSALDGGKSGYESYLKIAEITPILLKDNGYILLEVGINQATDVQRIFAYQGLRHVKTVSDLAGIERCVIMQKQLQK